MGKKQSKKSNFDNTIKKVENISNTVDVIMRNRLIIAFFLIVDGITFILNPDTTLSGMAQNIILLILLAAASVLITNLAAKTKDLKTISISIAIIALGAFFYFYPDLIASYIQLLLSLFIIYNGVTNLANIFHLNGLSNFTQNLANKYNKLSTHKPKATKVETEKFKEVDDTINTSLEEQKQKMLSPINNLVSKASKYSILYIIANVTSVILGIILLIFPNVSMVVWGIIFLYTGSSNLLIAVKTMGLSKKIKERKFKEIIFDAKQDENKTKDTKK